MSNEHPDYLSISSSVKFIHVYFWGIITSLVFFYIYLENYYFEVSFKLKVMLKGVTSCWGNLTGKVISVVMGEGGGGWGAIHPGGVAIFQVTSGYVRLPVLSEWAI